MDKFIINKVPPRLKGLMSLIPDGEENAKSMRELSRECGVSPREVRKIIENARRDGMIIASSDSGYFVPSCEEELNEFYLRTMYRVNTTLDTLRPVEEIVSDVLRDLIRRVKDDETE